MKSKQSKKIIGQMLAKAEVRINGDAPGDIQVHNHAFYDRVLAEGSLGLGESYMDGWWDCRALDQFFDKILGAGIENQARKNNFPMVWAAVKARLFNAQSRRRAFQVGERHYDIGNRLFSIMLDKRMNYSCGYWRNADYLDEAQAAKLDLICQKMDLKPGMEVLDVGCGWGALAEYASRTYDVNVTGVTVSRRQAEFAKARCTEPNVTILLKDYRELNKQYDRIASVGMFEHVGVKNYRTYMQIMRNGLKEDGFFLLQTIGGNRSVNRTDPWIEKYIFPNGMLPSPKQITAAAEGALVLEDWHSIGPDYDKTLMAWHKNFVSNWNQVKEDYDDRFFRMWTYYLLSCAGAFRSRRNQLWQIVFTKNGARNNYRAVR